MNDEKVNINVNIKHQADSNRSILLYTLLTQIKNSAVWVVDSHIG